MKQVHEDPAVKKLQKQHDKINKELQEISSETTRASSELESIKEQLHQARVNAVLDPSLQAVAEEKERRSADLTKQLSALRVKEQVHKDALQTVSVQLSEAEEDALGRIYEEALESVSKIVDSALDDVVKAYNTLASLMSSEEFECVGGNSRNSIVEFVKASNLLIHKYQG